MGGHLPGSKVTPEIAKIRGKNVGEDIISPSKFPQINTKEDLKDFVAEPVSYTHLDVYKRQILM